MATTHYIPSQRRIFLNAALAVLLVTASACSLVRGSAPTQTPTGPVTFPSVAPTPFAKLLMTEALPPPQEAPPQATEPETVETIPWTGIGPWVNIRDLVIDPRMPLILYAGTDGGMFKSTNGGQSWAAINDGLADPYIEDVVMDPATPATLYVAIGYSTPDGGGVFKSTDGGDHWSAARNGLPHHVSKLAIDPRTPTTLYAVTYFDQVYKSTNGGRSWSPAFIGLALDNPALVLVVDPITPNTLYLGTYRNGVYKSVDGGGHWNPASMGIDLDTTYENSVDELVMDPLTPSTLYAVTRYEGIFKTTNGGRDWMAFDPGFAPSVWGYSNLTLDPITPATMYLEGYELYKSTDGGRSWQAYYATGLPNMFISVVAVDPLDTSILYVGTEGGGIFTNRTYDSFVSVQMPTLTPPPAAATEAPVAAVPVPTEAPAVGVPAPTEPLSLSVKSTLAPLAFPFTVRGPLRYQKDVQLPPNARVLVLWSVTAEYPDYGYIFGEGTIDWPAARSS